MDVKALCVGLDCAAFVLAVAGLAAARFTDWFWVLIILAGVLPIIAGLIRWISERSRPAPPLGEYVRVIASPVPFPVDRSRDVLRRDVEAYPLTKRPFWDTDVMGAPE